MISIILECGFICRSDDKIADDARVNPDKQQLIRHLKAGESVLTRVRQE